MSKIAVTLAMLEGHNHIVGDIPRGVKIYERGGIEVMEQKPDYYLARVPHKDKTTKTVAVTFTRDGRDIEHHHCDCSWRSGGNPVCRHVTAAVLAIQGGIVEPADSGTHPIFDKISNANANGNMAVLSVKLTFHISCAHSLKEKRMVARSLIDKTRHKFNASVAEVDTQDLHQTLTLGVAAVSGEWAHTRNMLDEIIRFMEESADAELLSVDEI